MNSLEVLNLIIPRTEQNKRFANITKEKCAQFSESELNAAKMERVSKTLIVEVLDVNTKLSQSPIKSGIIEP